MIGQTISHYTIIEKLGEGGMGIVYKAHDTKLDRMIALKFLPEQVSSNEGDRARFLQEARAAAGLNHPNICTIYGIEEHDGHTFIAMEFVDGQTLREKARTMNLAKAIDVGVQIAEGLSVAHEKGVVHRDIKPENIMIRKDGIVQIMDFGLAKLRTSTVSRLTKQGSTIGTAGYMSPEQVQGHDTDHRSDIFSLGVLLYELFTGQLPFTGGHETALMYEIVNVDPAPLSAIRPEIDPEIDRIVLESLQKEPDERYNSVKDIAKDLKRFKRESSRSRVSRITAARPVMSSREYAAQAAPEPAPAQKTPVQSNRLPWILSGVFGLVAIGALVFHFVVSRTEPIVPVRFGVPPPEKSSFTGEMPKLSPDGKTLAFTASDSMGKIQIWVRPLSSMNATPLAGTEDATFPFWSPDSRMLGFFQNAKLRKIEATGGPVQSIADIQDARGGAWGSTGMIVYSPNFGTGLMAAHEAGGTPITLTSLDSTRHEDTHRWPEFLPDGKRFLYLARSSEDEKCAIMLGSTDGKEHKIVLAGCKSQAVLANGYILFLRDRTLMAQEFDNGKAEVRGDAFPISEQIGNDPSRNFGLFSASANGVLAVIAGGAISGERQLAWFDRSGKLLERVGAPGLTYDFSLSPDEKRVAYRRIDPQTRNQDIWVLDLARKTESRLTFRTSREDDPIWSPDGSKIVFDSNLEGVPNPNTKLSSGAGTEVLLWKNDKPTYPLDWSSDGKFVLANTDGGSTKTDIWAIPTTGNAKPFPVLQTPSNEDMGHFSPDGKWIAYTSNESGKSEVYVQAFPVSAGKWQISGAGGSDPMWSHDGKKVYYIAPDRQLFEVEIKVTGASIEQGIPKQLFITDVDIYNNPNRYAISRDDKQFLINISTSNSKSTPITVVLNWTSEVKTK